jgi:hypothetical protein
MIDIMGAINKWYDRQKEPKRFLIIFVPIALAILFIYIVPFLFKLGLWMIGTFVFFAFSRTLPLGKMGHNLIMGAWLLFGGYMLLRWLF